MRWGMATVPVEVEEEEPAVPVAFPRQLIGDGLRDMGDGVSVLLGKKRRFIKEGQLASAHLGQQWHDATHSPREACLIPSRPILGTKTEL